MFSEGVLFTQNVIFRFVSLKLLWLSSCGDLDRWRDHHWVLLTWTDCVNITVFCCTAALLVWLIGMIRFGMGMILWCLFSDWHWFSVSDICMQPFYFLGRYKTYMWACLSVSHLFLMKILHPCVFLSWLNLIEGKLKKIIVTFSKGGCVLHICVFDWNLL